MGKQCKKVFFSGVVILLWAANLLALFPCETGFAQGPDTLWTRTYGGIYEDRGFSAQQTSDGGYIVVGYTPTFRAANEKVYLIKTDVKGDTLWTRTYRGERGYSAQQTSDGGYIVVGVIYSDVFNGEICLIKTDVSGDTLWTRTYMERSDDFGCKAQETSDGGYIVVGYTHPFGVGNWDACLIKTDTKGDTLWMRTYGGPKADYGYSVQQTSDGGYIIAGETSSFGAGGYDVYLIKADAKGDTLWTRTYGGERSDKGFAVQQTSDGGYIVAGWTESFGAGYKDVYLIKADAKGDTLWTRTYGGTGWDEGHSVQQTPDNGYIIAGYTESFGAGRLDVYLIKTNANGDILWTKTYGGKDSDNGYSVKYTSDGGYIVAGYTYSFGAGDFDIYLIKTKPDPTGIKESSQEAIFISQIEPNPFKDRALIKYELPKNSNVYIVIYNLLGQEIKTLINRKQNAGMHTIFWDRRDNGGEKVSSGVYFLRFEAGEYKATRKLLIMR